jgi:hypothetical protein
VALRQLDIGIVQVIVQPRLVEFLAVAAVHVVCPFRGALVMTVESPF